MAAPDLGALCEDLAAELADVVATPVGESVVYARGRDFACVGAGFVAFRLPEDIAEAAARIADTAPIEEGPGWVRLTPSSHEPRVEDRVTAWFRIAWRHAGDAR